jgi:hypothetical protein
MNCVPDFEVCLVFILGFLFFCFQAEYLCNFGVALDLVIIVGVTLLLIAARRRMQFFKSSGLLNFLKFGVVNLWQKK